MTDKEVMKLAQKLITDFKCKSDTMIDFCNTVIKKFEQQPCEDSIRKLIREFDDKHPALFADYMQEFNNHPISEIVEYMWDMHDLIEDIRYRLPNESGVESEEEEW